MLSRLVEAILGSNDNNISGDEFLTKPPHNDGVIDHGNGITQEFKDSNEYWYRNGHLHRAGDLPSVIWSDGTQFWYKDGKLHRDGDKPAIVRADGAREWYKDGKLHRDGDKPATIWADGTVEYWVNDRRIK